jgi:hypothetical protein
MGKFAVIRSSLRARAVSGLACAIVTLAFTVQPVAAWTQETNQYTSWGYGSGYCGGSSDWPCVFWQEPHNYSITLYGEINGSLQYMNGFSRWVPDMADAFNNFNAIPAANPYEYVCLTPGCGQVNYYGGIVSCPLLAITSYSINTVEWNSTVGYYTFFIPYYVNVTYDNESRAHWNESDTYTLGGGCNNFNWDARYAARHETGHVQSLGHTGYTAIMNNVPPSPVFHTLQSNDIQGIEGIYTGTQPAS